MKKQRHFAPLLLGVCLALGPGVAQADPDTAETPAETPAETLEATSDYEAAAAAYERRAASDPNATAAPPALHRATLLRLGTGKIELAQKNAATYEAKYGTARPTESAELAFAVASVMAEAGNWAGARAQLDRTRPRWDKAPLDVRLGALIPEIS